ncbi:MAG: molecular chaperone DnaJ [Actinomycetota bacterium]
MSASLYEVLEVEQTVSHEEIKSSYRRLARKYHPDANPGDQSAESKFKEISQAYEVLSDPDRRAQYDRFGSTNQNQNPFGQGSVQDIFDMFFGGGGSFQQRNAGPPAGQDAQVVMEISLDDAGFGVTKDLTLTMPQPCKECSGSGAAHGSSPVACVECAGAGQVRRVRNSILGQMMTTSICNRCQGFGTRIETPCESCRGSGLSNEEVTLSVQVPAGVEDGSTMRLANKGPAGARGGGSGQLYVHLRITADERFERDGENLHHELHISFVEAALGAHLTAPTLRSEVKVEIETGTQTGTILRFRGEGMPRLHSRHHGELFVHIVVDTPTELDDESEALLRQLAQKQQITVAESGKRRKGHR